MNFSSNFSSLEEIRHGPELSADGDAADAVKRIFFKFQNFVWKFHKKFVEIKIWCAGVKDFKFWFSLGFRISNFTNLPNSKISQNRQILSQKNLFIAKFAGFRLPPPLLPRTNSKQNPATTAGRATTRRIWRFRVAKGKFVIPENLRLVFRLSFRCVLWF